MLVLLTSLLLPFCHGVFLLSPGTFYWKKPTPKPKVVPRVSHRIQSQPKVVTEIPPAANLVPSSAVIWGTNSRMPLVDIGAASVATGISRPRTKTYEGSSRIPSRKCCSGSPSKTWRKLFDAPLQVFSDRTHKNILKGKRLLGLRKGFDKDFSREVQRISPEDNKYYSAKLWKDKLLLEEENNLIKTLKSAWETVRKKTMKPVKPWSSFDPWHGKRKKRSTRDGQTKPRKVRFRFNITRTEKDREKERNSYQYKSHVIAGENYNKEIDVASRYAHDTKQNFIVDEEDAEFAGDQFVNNTDTDRNNTCTLFDTIFDNVTKEIVTEPQIAKLKLKVVQLTTNSSHRSEEKVSKQHLTSHFLFLSRTAFPTESSDYLKVMPNKRGRLFREFQYPHFNISSNGTYKYSGMLPSHILKNFQFTKLPWLTALRNRTANRAMPIQPAFIYGRVLNSVYGRIYRRNRNTRGSILKMVYATLANRLRKGNAALLNESSLAKTKVGLFAYLTNSNVNVGSSARSFFQTKSLFNSNQSEQQIRGTTWQLSMTNRSKVSEPIGNMPSGNINLVNKFPKVIETNKWPSSAPTLSASSKSLMDKQFPDTSFPHNHHKSSEIMWKKSFFINQALLFDDGSPLVRNCTFGCSKRQHTGLDPVHKTDDSRESSSNETTSNQLADEPSISDIRAVKRINNDILFLDILSALARREKNNLSLKFNFSRPEVQKVMKIWNINNLDFGQDRTGGHRFRRSIRVPRRINPLRRGSAKYDTDQPHIYMTPSGRHEARGPTNLEEIAKVNDLRGYFTNKRIPRLSPYLSRSEIPIYHNNIGAFTDESAVPSATRDPSIFKEINHASEREKRDMEFTDFDMFNKAHIDWLYSPDNIEIKEATFKTDKQKPKHYTNIFSDPLLTKSYSAFDPNNLSTSNSFKINNMDHNEKNLLTVKRCLKMLRKKPTVEEIRKDFLAILNVIQYLVRKHKLKILPHILQNYLYKNLNVLRNDQEPFVSGNFNAFMKRASTNASARVRKKRNIINSQESEIENKFLLNFQGNNLFEIMNSYLDRSTFTHPAVKETTNLDEDGRKETGFLATSTSHRDILLNHHIEEESLKGEQSPTFVPSFPDGLAKPYIDLTQADTKRFLQSQSMADHRLDPFRLINDINDKIDRVGVPELDGIIKEQQFPMNQSPAPEARITLTSFINRKNPARNNYEMPSSLKSIIIPFFARDMSGFTHYTNSLKPNVIPRVPFQDPFKFKSKSPLNIPFMTKSPDGMNQIPRMNPGFGNRKGFDKADVRGNRHFQGLNQAYFNRFDGNDNHLGEYLPRPVDDEDVTLTYYLPKSGPSRNRNNEPSKEEKNLLTSLSIVRPIGFSQFVSK